MTVVSNPPDAEVQELRRALGDMAALSSLPELWLNSDANGIASSLAGALVRVLDLDFVRVVTTGASAVEQRAASFDAGVDEQLSGAFPSDADGLGETRDLGEGLRALCIGLGVAAESRLYAVARREAFPSPVERLAMVTAANQAAVALRRAQVETQLRAQTEALNRERNAVATLNRKLAGERDKLRLLFDQAPGFMAMLQGPDHVFELCNESYYTLVGRRDLLGRSVRDVFPDLGGQGFFDLLDQVFSSGEAHVAKGAAIDLQRAQDSGPERRYLDFIYQPVHDADGRVIGIFAEGHDVTEQTLAAEHRQLLVNELNHRVKNTLATVQSLAHQTLRGAASLLEAKATLTSRLMSLSRAHDVLTRENWAGADAAEIVAEAMRAHEEPGHIRITTRGPKVKLDARAALALSMALHELATNAAKYGALSNDDGTVTIDWKLDGPAHLSLRWCENGGPALSEAPRRQGFGSRLLKSGLASELGAPAEVEYAPEGLVCRIRAPLLSRTDGSPSSESLSQGLVTNPAAAVDGMAAAEVSP